MSQDHEIFIGAELDPAFGNWLRLNDYADEDEFNEAVAKLQAKIRADGYEDISIMDKSGFGDMLQGNSTATAWVLHEVLEELSDTEGEALDAWMNHRGVDYSLFAAGKLRRSDEIIDDFREDYRGTFESEEKYAEERFTEHWDALGLEKHAESLQAYVFNHMNWERLAYDYSCDDVYYGNRDTSGVPVFWRN